MFKSKLLETLFRVISIVMGLPNKQVSFYRTVVIYYP